MKALIYVFYYWGIYIFNGEFKEPPYQDAQPESVYYAKPCAEPVHKLHKSQMPVAGDTVWVNDVSNAGRGVWAVLLEREIQ